MADNFVSSRNFGPMGPSVKYEAVTPNDSVDLSQVTVGIHIGGAGNICLVRPDGVEVTLVGMTVGMHPICAKRIKSTNTTATAISAFY